MKIFILYRQRNLFLFLALPALPKRPSVGVSNGTNKVANLQATKDKYESPDLQASKKPVINQDNARVGTSQKTLAQKVSENNRESATKKTYTQKISGNKTTEKPAQQNGISSNNSSSSNKNNSTNSSNKTSNMNSSNISGSNTNSNASLAEAQKKSIRTDNLELVSFSDLNSTKQVNKRNSANKLITAESGESSKPIEIEVKTYTALPNTSAFIEVRPNTPVTNEIGFLNNPDQISWPIYQYLYPQQLNGLHAWYVYQYQPPLPSGLTHVPTEELVHSQSFSNTPGFGPQLLYQYPVKETAHKRPSFSPRPKYAFSNLLTNKAKTSKPDRIDDYNLLPNYAVGPLVRISPHQTDTSPQVHYSLLKDYFKQKFLPQPNGIQNSFYTQYEPNLKNKPAVTKYVTKSYTLKTHPNLEWVPL